MEPALDLCQTEGTVHLEMLYCIVLLHFDIKRILTKRIRRIYMSSSLFIGQR
eukprot:SAG31_NODE_32450_length_355_cov_11.390625_1_plen_51_part_10